MRSKLTFTHTVHREDRTGERIRNGRTYSCAECGLAFKDKEFRAGHVSRVHRTVEVTAQ